MNLNSFRSESTDNANETTNSAKSTLTKKSQQELLNRGEESKSTKTETPNPQKAPLNYIDNMGERETTQKKYLKEIEQKQLQLATTLSSYEDKLEEIDQFKLAKYELEKKSIDIMGIICRKLTNDNEFLLKIFSKLYDDIPEGVGNQTTEYEDPNQRAETDNETDNETDYYEEVQNGEVYMFDIIDSEIIRRFYNIFVPENWNNCKKLLSRKEIFKTKKLYNSVKKQYDTYFDLQSQINIMENKLVKLEGEENNISETYLKSKKEVQKMSEDMQKVSETYFLNSYLSTKNVKLDSFISSPLVEKQIKNIIEQNRKGNDIPKTILLYGKPNLGKTYAANVLASELGRKMYHIRSYDIFTGGFSDPNAMLDAIFTGLIKKKEPCIVFLDEIEDFAGGYNGSPYQNLMENTIRHHVSKIKDSSLDIMIIGAISDKNKIGTSLLKQDVFSKQIHFDFLSQDRCVDFIKQIAKEYKVNLDVDVNKLVNQLKDNYHDQESLKKLVNMAIDCHKMENEETDNITLSTEDFDKAIKYKLEHNNSLLKGVGFST